MDDKPSRIDVNNTYVKYKQINISKIWKILILLSLMLSVFSLSINFNLLNIEKFTFLKFGTEKSIVDKSINANVTSEISFKNLIDSPINFSYTKKTQISSNRLPQTIGMVNNKKVNFHNVIMHDIYNNIFFLKDYPYNTTIWYADCNEEATNCAIYSSFLLENNLKYLPCFEFESPKKEGEYQLGTITKLNYYEINSSACYDYKNIT